MMVNPEIVKKIKDYFDLNVYETKVWLALLGRGVASAGEIAEISGVPRSRTYDVLESLEKNGFAIVKLGKPVKYLGVKPRIIIEKMKNNIMKHAEEKVETLSKIKESSEFVQLEELYKEGILPVRREDISASLKGKANISNQLKEILENAKKEVVICTSAEELKSKSKLFQQTLDRLNKNKIKVVFALSGDDKVIQHLSKTMNQKFKQVPIDAKFFIIDRNEVLFYTSKKTDEEDMAVWLNSEFFANAFADMFEKAIKVN